MNDPSHPLSEGPVGMDRIGLQRRARSNEHSLIEGYCLNLRQYSRKGSERSIFFLSSTEILYGAGRGPGAVTTGLVAWGRYRSQYRQ